MTVPLLLQKKQRGEKIVMATCYDFPSARLLEQAGVDILFVGDSLGDNVLGYRTTIPVTMDEMIHHARAVRRGTRRSFILVDMPFLSYQVSAEEAVRNAGRIMKDAQVEAVKLEGGTEVAPLVARITAAGIPVVGHVGLTPQYQHALGGKRIQGRDEQSAERILADALALAESGAFAVVLELMPAELARQITSSCPIPTIGIGAGPHCDGQVIVYHDMVGYFPDRQFKHVKRYAEVGKTILEAAERYAEDVRSGAFPADEHSF